ncbi:hypothetical protein BJV78DRAFT_1135690 [Lactifluus subvellereus]|nr:hypothetical protein BJV78DRAFT_1135690 [Lactifluus subvellereus]
MADQWHSHAIQAAGIFVHTLVAGAIAFVGPSYRKIAYHTSILTGEGWVLELLNGHLEQMHTELGVCVPVFQQLVLELQEIGLGLSRHVSLKEQVAIFLYASVTGLSIQHLGEHFQHSNEMISK